MDDIFTPMTADACAVVAVVFVALALVFLFVAVLDTITHWRDR